MPSKPPSRRTPAAAWIWLGVAALSAGCGQEPAEPVESIAPLEQQRLVDAFHADLRATLLAGIEQGRADVAREVFAPRARGVLVHPQEWPRVQESPLVRVRRDQLAGGDELKPTTLAAELVSWLPPGLAVERSQLEAHAFVPHAELESASGSFELHVAGSEPRGARVDLRASFQFAAGIVGGSWRLQRLVLLGGSWQRSTQGPRFRDVTRRVGLTYADSPTNQRLVQGFIDEHRTLALGGLTALDWNSDGFIDLLATRRRQVSQLFLNDGRGGFVPRPHPIDAPDGAGAFFLWIDLDGDGREELVSTEVERFDGAHGWIAIYTRSAVEGAQARGEGWTKLPRALRVPLPIGRRNISVQTIEPFDLDADGDLDLFFGVYGDSASRGEMFSTVDAHDGADNHLFVNEGSLEFSEVSAARGIEGTRFTYVSKAFDFDSDGDVDLWEGNDFGANTLWVNDGEGHFSADRESPLAGDTSFTMGVTLGDWANTGRWSLYVSNMSSEAGLRMAPVAPLRAESRARMHHIARGNFLFTQDEDDPSLWVEHARSAGVWEGEWAWGSVFLDVDNDGDQELWVTNGFTSHEDETRPDWDPWYWNQVVADAGFLERGELSHDVNAASAFVGSFAGYQRDRLFSAPDDDRERFVDTAWIEGLDLDHDGRCVIALDVDGDGDLDVAEWTLQGLVLLENRSAPASFTRVRLVPSPASHTLGAVVSVSAGGVLRRRLSRATDGFQSQAPRDLHFGLGEAALIEELTVHWPSGTIERFEDLAVGRLLVVQEGAGEVRLDDLPRWPSDALEREPVREVRDARGQVLRAFAFEPAPADIAAFEALALDEPTYPDLLLYEGRRALAASRARESVALLGELIQRHPDHSRGHAALGQARLALGQPAIALRCFERAVEHDPDYALGHYNRAVILNQIGRSMDAVAPFTRAVSLEPDRADWWLAYGETAAVVGRPDVAERAFVRATELDPGLADAHLLLGKARAQQGRYAEAIPSFERVLELDPDRGEARQALVLARRLAAE